MKNKVQKTKMKINKQQLLRVHHFLEKEKSGNIIPTIICYPKNR